jgi:hypothetical protein
VAASYDYSIAKRSPRSTYGEIEKESRLVVVAGEDAEEPDGHTRLILARLMEPLAA